MVASALLAVLRSDLGALIYIDMHPQNLGAYAAKLAYPVSDLLPGLRVGCSIYTNGSHKHRLRHAFRPVWIMQVQLNASLAWLTQLKYSSSKGKKVRVASAIITVHITK